METFNQLKEELIKEFGKKTGTVDSYFRKIQNKEESISNFIRQMEA